MAKDFLRKYSYFAGNTNWKEKSKLCCKNEEIAFIPKLDIKGSVFNKMLIFIILFVVAVVVDVVVVVVDDDDVVVVVVKTKVMEIKSNQ